MAMVATLALITSFSILMLFQRVIHSHDGQARAQLRIDYAQKEDALLRALIAIVPNRAIQVMRSGSAASPAGLTWEAIFNEAIALAGADGAMDGATLASFGINGLITANPGDDAVTATTLVNAIRGNTAIVNSGTLDSTDLLFDSRFQGKIPDPLSASQTIMTRDSLYPIITDEKVFAPNWAGSALLSNTEYPLYNLIPYPDIRFGYAEPGAPFVAKRNWWAFQVTYGAGVVNVGMPSRTKNYVLSIYEIPAQVPISAEAFLSVGAHANGAAWTDVSIDGGLFGGRLETSQGFTLPNGNLAARRGLDLGGGTSVDGMTVSGNYNDFGVREAFLAQHLGDLQPVSLSADSGRVAFLPINRGTEFFQYSSTAETSALSPTTWEFYSRGAQRCAMRLFVTRVGAALDQTPTRLELHYKAGGADAVHILDRLTNWAAAGTSAGNLIPFQTEHTETGRKALVLHLERLPAYLSSLGASGPDINHSMVINPDPSRDSNIQAPQFPTVETEMALVLRNSANLSAYSAGFSLVTNLRLYFGDNFNSVPVPQPTGSGLPAGELFYPPISLYAPEKRYGTTLKTRPVDYQGQISSLAQGDAQAVHPLDFRTGTFEQVTPALISADLRPIRSPAELPPIFLMNWLVVIEEIF